MIEYLEKLVEDKEYQKALDYAEQLLLNPENTSWDLMVIYCLLLEARFQTGEYYGAQVAGQLALKMSRELQAWDYFGKAALWMGVACARLRQLEDANAAYYEYLSLVPHYTEARQHHPLVLYNIGVNLVQLGRLHEGFQMLHRATDVAIAHKDDRKAHGIRHALIDAYLRHGELEHIPALLAKCAHYLRHNRDATDFGQTLLWHQVLRVRYALATDRPRRALRVSQRGLRMAEGVPDMVFQLQILLAQVYERLGNTRSALETVVGARGVSIEARRFDLEYEAANYMYALLNTHPELVDHLDTETI